MVLVVGGQAGGRDETKKAVFVELEQKEKGVR